jgi:hypothetical protein
VDTRLAAARAVDDPRRRRRGVIGGITGLVVGLFVYAPTAPPGRSLMPLTRHHATAFLDHPDGRVFEDLRRTWDPDMARQIAAHITLIYPEEISDPEELAARAERAAARTAPFRIVIGSPFHSGSPADGVFLRVSDVDHGIRRFRAAAVPDGQAVDFPAHTTIAHPRTSRRGEQAWAELGGLHLDIRFTISQVAITAYDGDRWPSVATFPLTGPPAAPAQTPLSRP